MPTQAGMELAMLQLLMTAGLLFIAGPLLVQRSAPLLHSPSLREQPPLGELRCQPANCFFLQPILILSRNSREKCQQQCCQHANPARQISIRLSWWCWWT